MSASDDASNQLHNPVSLPSYSQRPAGLLVTVVVVVVLAGGAAVGHSGTARWHVPVRALNAIPAGQLRRSEEHT